VYVLDAGGGAALADLTGATLDEVSRQLPAGVYTTLRTYGPNRVLGLSAHLARLAESWALLGQPGTLDLDRLRAGLRAALGLVGLAAAGGEGSARLRLTVPLAGAPALVSLEPFAPYPAALYEQGARCLTRPLERETPRAKHTRAIAKAQAARADLPPDIHEVLRVNAGGQVLEGLSSNFFAVLDGALRTARDGILLGITRRLTLSVAAAQPGLLIIERPITLAELPRLSEAFLTSASREIMPVTAINDQTIGAGAPGPITRALLAGYRARAADEAEVV
jgi:branched-chain amino acid aminotransferase